MTVTILDVPNEVVQNFVLPLLQLRDLASFSSTCTIFRHLVQGFVNHYINASGGTRKQIARKFMSSGVNSMHTMEEKQLVQRMNHYESEQRQEFECSLPFYAFVTSYGRSRRRIAVKDAKDFPWLGGRYIPVVSDTQLGRDVVVLDSVCWLFFQIDFHKIPPGRYRINVRIKISTLVHFTTGKPARLQIFLLKPGAKGKACYDEVQVQQRFFPTTIWTSLRNVQANQQFKLNDIEIFRENHDWFWFKMPHFEIDEEVDLNFRWRDIENLCWKHGLGWDFAELEQL